jgi:hypothetical protein
MERHPAALSLRNSRFVRAILDPSPEERGIATAGGLAMASRVGTVARLSRRVEDETPVAPTVDATTILDNVVELDRMLDEGSREKLGEVPYLELSKHLKIKRG